MAACVVSELGTMVIAGLVQVANGASKLSWGYFSFLVPRRHSKSQA